MLFLILIAAFVTRETDLILSHRVCLNSILLITTDQLGETEITWRPDRSVQNTQRKRKGG